MTTRRGFLQVALAGGAALVIGVDLGRRAEAAEPAPPFAPNAWLRVDADGRVTVILNKSEMGQGIATALPMLVVEELEVELARVTVEFAPFEARYAGPGMPIQLTGGSTSIRSEYEMLRRAGATARTMLVAAAAQRWSVPPSSCRAEKGNVIHSPTGRKLGYGALVADAAALPVPAPTDVPLKPASALKVVGTRAPRLDTPSKVDGTAQFGIDVKLPGLLVATVLRCPVFGGKLKKLDAARAKATPGVRHVVEIAGGVALVGDGYWPAMQGRRALDVTWDEGANRDVSSASIEALFAAAAGQPGAVARHDGDAAAALAGAAKQVEAVYQVPFLAHSPMEPLNATAVVRADGCEIWAPTQCQSFAHAAAMKITGLPAASIRVHTTLLGGGFGRRAEADFVADAVEIAKRVGAPVKVIWSREDEIQHGFYRPAAYTHLEAGLDADGWPVALRQRVVSPSIFTRVMPQAMHDGIDRAAVEGTGADMPYAVPNVHVEYVHKEAGVPVGFWRSVGHSSNAFVLESFLDELAAAGGKDPLALRRRLLAKAPRHRAVLELAASKAGWGTPPPSGRARGIAVHESFGSFVAEVAEVSLVDGAPRVHRVVCAIDCGPVVNPDTVEAQMQGGIVFGLTAALRGAITIDRGRVVQSNFHDYQMLRMHEMPRVEVHILPSTEKQGGVGEPGVPPIAPAVANALYALTRKRVRRLPLEGQI
jgi:isoquinoline 1-oxidoreductase beta subunit